MDRYKFYKHTVFKIKYALKNWKLLVHLVFRTYYFGVNNQFWCRYPSIFGLPFYKRLFYIRTNYQLVKTRGLSGFIPSDDMKKLFNYS